MGTQLQFLFKICMHVHVLNWWGLQITNLKHQLVKINIDLEEINVSKNWVLRNQFSYALLIGTEKSIYNILHYVL